MAINNALNAPIPFAVGKGGTGSTTLTQHGVLVGNGTSAINVLAPATNGQLLIGSTGNAPVVAALTAGTGIDISNGAGTITISSTDAGITWQASDTATMAVNNGYIAIGAGLVTLTLPAVAPVGSVFQVVGQSTGGFVIQAAAGQIINFGDDPTSTAGSIASTNRYDSLSIVCTVANTTFNVFASQGNLTVA